MEHEYKMRGYALFSFTPALIWRCSIEIKGVIPPYGVNSQQLNVNGAQSWKGESSSRSEF